MNALARFEGFMQELMDRRVVRLLGGNLQPAELAQAIGRGMEAGTQSLVAPNRFSLLVHPDDYADLHALDPALERKLADYAVELARERGLNFNAPPEVYLLADAEVQRGDVRVEPSIADPIEPASGSPSDRAWKGGAPLRFEVPAPDGVTVLPLDQLPFTIGRGMSNQLVLPDPSVSRDHALVESVDGTYRVRDLGSRNGTHLNGQRISEADLRDGDRLAIGTFEVTVRIRPSGQ